jgi:hypothetical protein
MEKKKKESNLKMKENKKLHEIIERILVLI